VLSLLTIPPNIAMIFTSSYLKIIIGSIIVGFAGTVTGLIISYFINIPTGATIVFVLALIWIISKLLRGWVEKRW
jgi:zinc transport system permease protein